MGLLFKTHYRSLVAFSAAITDDQDAARDIVQDAFAHLWERHRDLSQPHDQPVEHYLLRVVKFKSITYYKRHLRIQDLRRKYAEEQQELASCNPEIVAMKREVRMEVRELVSRCSQREQECLELKIDGDLTNAEIAEQLGITVKAVERAITSAYKRIRRNGQGWFHANHHGA